MTRMLRLAILGVAITLFTSSTGWSADEKEGKPEAKPSSYAILIGPGEFEDKQIKPRPTAEADVKALYDLLTDKSFLGIDPDHISLLISSEDAQRKAKKATKENIVAGFKDLASKANKNDLIFVFIAGQGAAVGDRPCFFATDSKFADRAKTAIQASDLEGELKGFKPEQLLVLLDINLKGFDPGKESIADPSIMDFVRLFLGTKDKDKDEEQPLPTGRAVILSGLGVVTPVSADGKLNIFAQVVVDALRGAADKEGYEADGTVTVDELVSYLEKETPSLIRKHGKTNEEKRIAPFVEFARASHFGVTKNPGVTPKVEERLRILAELEANKKIDKEVAEQGKKLLARMPKLKSLQELRKDYQKLVDGQSTVEDFLASRTKILDSMKIAKDAADSYARQVIRGMETVKDNYIKELNLGEMAANAIKGLYLRADEKVPKEISDKLKGAKELKRTALVELLTSAREPLGKREDLDNKKDVEISLQAAMSNLDPYSSFIDKESVDQAEKGIKGFFTGIGVQIRYDLVKDGLLVVTPIRNSPAYRAGIKTGDIITKIRRPVDSQGNPLNPPEEISTKGMKTDEAVKLILGQPGTEVGITVDREGEKEPLDFTILRGRVEVESVLGYKRKSDDSWDYYIDPKSKIAYIYLTQFARKSFIDMEQVVEKLNKDGVKGLVLDLRFNPGGYLDVAKDICDLFIDDGLIVTIRPRVGEVNEITGKADKSYTNFPMVCLVNGGSASGSEIVAACLQDHHRAVIMGERSFGKGSVQNISRFAPTGGEIKLTTATFWRPNGKNLNKSSTDGKEDKDWGVRPEKEYTLKLTRQEQEELADHLRELEIIPRKDAPKTTETKKEYKDKQLEMAVEYLRNQIKVSYQTPKSKDSVKE